MQQSESANDGENTPEDLALLERVVRTTIADKKNVDPASVQLDSSLRDLGIDSLDGIDLMFSFEDQYGIAIPDHVVQQLKTVRDVVDAVAHARETRLRPTT